MSQGNVACDEYTTRRTQRAFKEAAEALADVNSLLKEAEFEDKRVAHILELDPELTRSGHLYALRLLKPEAYLKFQPYVVLWQELKARGHCVEIHFIDMYSHYGFPYTVPWLVIKLK